MIKVGVSKWCVLAFVITSPALAGTLETVSLTLWGEARNQDYAGKSGVASVIWNRANANPARFKAVCLAPHQFSCWRKREFTQPMPDLHKPQDRLAWRDCVTLASLMCNGTFLPDFGARHYHEARIKPYWSVNAPMLASVGDHVFYK